MIRVFLAAHTLHFFSESESPVKDCEGNMDDD